jgi:hypothetical protein
MTIIQKTVQEIGGRTQEVVYVNIYKKYGWTVRVI